MFCICERLKGYEGVSRNFLTRRVPAIIRLDGKAFHTLSLIHILLFQIDPRPFQATLDQAQGRLEQYEATLKKYKLDVERYTPLVKTGSVRRKPVSYTHLDVYKRQLL